MAQGTRLSQGLSYCSPRLSFSSGFKLTTGWKQRGTRCCRGPGRPRWKQGLPTLEPPAQTVRLRPVSGRPVHCVGCAASGASHPPSALGTPTPAGPQPRAFSAATPSAGPAAAGPLLGGPHTHLFLLPLPFGPALLELLGFLLLGKAHGLLREEVLEAF